MLWFLFLQVFKVDIMAILTDIVIPLSTVSCVSQLPCYLGSAYITEKAAIRQW